MNLYLLYLYQRERRFTTRFVASLFVFFSNFERITKRKSVKIQQHLCQGNEFPTRKVYFASSRFLCFLRKEHKILKRKKRRSDKPIARDWPRAIHNCREAKFDPHFFFADRDSNVESDGLFENSERRSGIESSNV